MTALQSPPVFHVPAMEKQHALEASAEMTSTKSSALSDNTDALKSLTQRALQHMSEL